MPGDALLTGNPFNPELPRHSRGGKEEISFPARQKTKIGEGNSIHPCLPNQGLSRVPGAGAEAGEEGEEARPPSEEEEEDDSRRQGGWFYEGRSSIFPHKGL